MGSAVFATEARLSVPTVILKRTACRGWCPVYSVTVTPDGVVRFEGHEYVVKPGKHARRISADSLARLKHAVDDADVMHIGGRYVPGEHQCERVYDAPSFAVAVFAGADQTWVTAGSLCAAGATADEIARIAKLADTIDEIAGTSKWIGSEDQRRRLQRKP